MVKFILCKFYHKKRRLEKQKALHRRPKKSTKTLEEVAWELCLKGWKDLGEWHTPSEGEMWVRALLGKGPGWHKGGAVSAEALCWGGWEPQGGGLAQPLPLPNLPNPPGDHSYRHPPQVTSELMPPLKSLPFHSSSPTHVLLLGNPFCLMKSIPSRWASPSLQSLPGLQNSSTLPTYLSPAQESTLIKGGS